MRRLGHGRVKVPYSTALRTRLDPTPTPARPRLDPGSTPRRPRLDPAPTPALGRSRGDNPGRVHGGTETCPKRSIFYYFTDPPPGPGKVQPRGQRHSRCVGVLSPWTLDFATLAVSTQPKCGSVAKSNANGDHTPKSWARRWPKVWECCKP